MKKNLILAVCFCLLMGTAAMASSMWETPGTENYKQDVDYFIFTMVSSGPFGINDDGGLKNRIVYGDDNPDPMAGMMQFVFWKDTVNPNVANLTFEVTPLGISSGEADLSFKTENFLLINFNNVFSPTTAIAPGWDGRTSGGSGNTFTPTTAQFSFASGIDWDEFTEMLPVGKIQIHVQSINYQNIQSIPNAWFVYAPGEPWDDGCSGLTPDNPMWDILGCGGSKVPEPGSILLLGTGIIGLGLAARRKMGKK